MLCAGSIALVPACEERGNPSAAPVRLSSNKLLLLEFDCLNKSVTCTCVSVVVFQQLNLFLFCVFLLNTGLDY